MREVNNGYYIDDETTTQIMSKFLDMIHDDLGWYNTSLLAGTVLSGESTEIEVVFDSKNLNSGDYTSTLQIASNDPVTPQVDISVALNVEGVPVITSSEDSLDFGTLSLGNSASRLLTIGNNGFDTLNVAGLSRQSQFQN